MKFYSAVYILFTFVRPKDWLCTRQGWVHAYVWSTVLWWQRYCRSTGLYCTTCFLLLFCFPVSWIFHLHIRSEYCIDTVLYINNMQDLNAAYFLKKQELSCCRESMRCFVSLNVLLSHSRSFEIQTLLRMS